MKRLTMFVVIMALTVFTATASANDINFSGGVNLHQTGIVGSPSVSITFNNLVVGGVGADTLAGTAVSLTPDTSFSFTSLAGSQGLFSPNSGTLNIGTAATGTLSGTITFVNIVGGPTTGGSSFTINVGLSNISYSATGTSNLINSFRGNPNGAGLLTFQFTAGPNTTLSDLLNLSLNNGGTLANSGDINTTVSGSVTVPEPASLFLLGSGLLTGGGFLRRRLQR